MNALYLLGGVLLVLFFAASSAKGFDLNPQTQYRIEWSSVLPLEVLKAAILHAAREAGISAAKVAAIAYIESRGNPNAVNPADPSYGMMELQIPTAKFYADSGDVVNAGTLISDPALNLKLGSRFLADLERKYSTRFTFGEWAQAYNVGETKFNKGTRNPGYGAKLLDESSGQRVFFGPGELESLFSGEF